MELILIRHTSVAVHRSVVCGSSDVDVARSFVEESAAAQERLTAIWREGPTAIVSSPAVRCRLLAERIGTVRRVDDRLREMGFGDWEMLSWSEVPRPELDA